MKLIAIFLMIISLAGLRCTDVKAQSTSDNTIYIDQVGSNNSISIDQTGNGHSATVSLGNNNGSSNVDYTTIAIIQQGAPKTASVEIKAGSNNSVSIQQDGSGNHTAAIQNLNGSGNQFNITQSGNGKHEFTVTNTAGSTNDANVLNAQQTGGVGAEKTFNVWLNGATGANISVQQTNPTTASQGSMSIQCMPGTCGNWSYIRN
jgi:hypothetical protein